MNIRRDIWAVKVLGNGFSQWCYERMFRSAASARRYRQGLRPMLGYSLESKIVHPSSHVVGFYVACGNVIHD